jgi:hypothetical protein
MINKNDTPKGLKKKVDRLTKADNGSPVNPEEASRVNSDSDTEPDEFISPKADTDEPIDHQILNDAVLRGEPHTDNTTNLPKQDEPEQS